MVNILSKVTRFLRQVRGLFSGPLPTGMTEFERWAASLASTYTLPTADFESIKFTLSSVIMHLGPQTDRKAQYYFVKTLRAAAAKQVAHGAFQDIKIKQQEAMKAAQTTAEASAPTVEASNGAHPIQTH